jgi:hypothetical protein
LHGFSQQDEMFMFILTLKESSGCKGYCLVKYTQQNTGFILKFAASESLIIDSLAAHSFLFIHRIDRKHNAPSFFWVSTVGYTANHPEPRVLAEITPKM